MPSSKAAYGPGSGIYMYNCACGSLIQLEEDRIVHVGKKVCKDGAIYILVDWTFWCILTLSAFVIYANRYSSAYTPILHMYTYRYKLIHVHVWFLQSMPVLLFFNLNYPCTWPYQIQEFFPRRVQIIMNIHKLHCMRWVGGMLDPPQYYDV